MDRNLEGKVALITGAGRGLGRSDALALAARGAKVVVTDVYIEPNSSQLENLDKMNRLAIKENISNAAQTVEEIKKQGGVAMALELDVTNRKQVKEVFEEVKAEWDSSVDILVNNAGLADNRIKFEDQLDEIWDRDIQVNLTGAYNCIKNVWKDMKEKGWGRVINMSSIAGVLGGYGQSSYSTTKAGLIGLTKSLALEGARYGITCNAIVPGPIKTETFTMKTKLGIKSEMNERIVMKTAMRKMGDPEDIANLVCFLASDDSKYMTGQEIRVAGGIDLFVF